MKIRCILVLMVILLPSAGCFDSSDGYLHFTFEVNYNVPEQTMPGDPLLALLPPQPIPEIPVDMNTDTEFSSQVFDHLVRIRLEELSFAITANSTDPAYDDLESITPTPDDWSFLQSAEIWVRYPGTDVEGLVAFVPEGDPQLASGSPVLAFVCLNTDILDYFDSGHNTTLVLRAIGSFPPDDVIFQASAKFKVTAALLK